MKKVLKWSAVGSGLFLTGLAGMIIAGAVQSRKTAEAYDS